MVAKVIAIAALVAAGFLVAGYAVDQARAANANQVALTGVVKFFAGSPIHGFGMPTAYELAGQTDYEPLLLRSGGSLVDPLFLDFEGHRVVVSGKLSYVETQQVNHEEGEVNDDYWILDVTSIKLAE